MALRRTILESEKGSKFYNAVQPLEDVELRRAALPELVRWVAEEGIEIKYSWIRILKPTDIPFMIQQAIAASDVTLQDIWIKLVVRSFSWSDDMAWYDAMLEAWVADPERFRRLRSCFMIDLDSEEARDLR